MPALRYQRLRPRGHDGSLNPAQYGKTRPSLRDRERGSSPNIVSLPENRTRLGIVDISPPPAPLSEESTTTTVRRRLRVMFDAPNVFFDSLTICIQLRISTHPTCFLTALNSPFLTNPSTYQEDSVICSPGTTPSLAGSR